MNNMYENRIGNTQIKIILGDITEQKSDAYIVPQFDNCASYGGVGGAIARSGATKGLDEFDEYASMNKPLPFGNIHVTESGAGNSYYLLNAVSVGSDKKKEFNVVNSSVYHALKASEKMGIKSVSCPAMGTGIIGNLLDNQSAKAMFSALDRFSLEGGKLDVFQVVIYSNRNAYNDFVNVVENKEYENIAPEIGQRKFDIGRWVSGMKKDGVDVHITKQRPNLN